MNTNERIFIGVQPCGIVYADRQAVVDGDYAGLAFLPYRTLELRFEPTCPETLKTEIRDHAQSIICQRGQQFEVSSCGQTVLLGE